MRHVITAIVVALTCVQVSAEQITDDFNDGILDPAWQVVTQTGGTSWDESGGTLNIGGSLGQTGELVIRYNRAMESVGSVRIDYNWVSCPGHKARVGLGLFDNWEGSSGFLIKGIKHSSSGRQHSVDGNNYMDSTYYYAGPAPDTGSFMIERNADNFRVCYLDGGTWQTLFEAQHDFGGTPLYPYLFTSNSNTNPSWQVAIDNFQADVAPEPSTFALVLVGITSLCIFWFRKQRNRSELCQT